ncbi:MAG: energy transducer TonB [Bacteroidales bacterium]|nr:energy transducer TonB [Bacteroidales bacterium]
MKKSATIFGATLALLTMFAGPVLASDNDDYAFNGKATGEMRSEENDSTEFKSSFTMPTDGMDLNRELASLIRYPEKAISEGIEGQVKVLCTIDAEGNVTDVKILKDIGGDCALAAVAAVRNLKFNPATQNGFPRPITLTIPVNFSLEKR